MILKIIRDGKMRDEIEFNDAEQSEFNAAIATLQRIHEIKKWLAVSTVKNDLSFYYQHLKMYYKELYPMFTSKKEADESKKVSEKATQKKRWDDAKGLKFNSNEEQQNILNFLEEWELELRQIEQIKGMNLPKKPDSRWALTRR